MENRAKTYIIYKAQNTITGECYIGASTKSLEERKRDHINKSNRVKANYFHQAIRTFGADGFEWKQIDTATTINELAEKEEEYIFKYNSLHQGLNSNKGSGGFKKKVYQYDIQTGELLNSYDDLTSAGNAVNATKKSISNVCLSIDKTCKGYYWSYSSTIKSFSTTDLRKKEVMQYNLEGDLLNQYLSVAEASKKSGISKTCISRCCRGEREQSGGYFWRYS